MPSPGERDNQTRASALAALDGTRQILLAEGLADAARQLVTMAHELLGFEAVGLYVPTPEGADLRLESVWPEAAPLPSSLLLDDGGLVSQMLTHRRPAHCVRVADLADRAEDPSCPWLCAAPLAALEAPTGVVVGRCAPGSAAPPLEQLQGLQALAVCAAMAVARPQFEQVRDRMVSSVSHELRTPLTSVRAFSEMLLDGDAGRINARQRRYLERIAEGADRLERLTAGMLHLSRLRLGPDALELQPTAVKPFLQDVALTLEVRAVEKQITLRVEAPADLPLLVTDPQWLQQALCNLVDNAIKYSPPASTVLLSVQARNGQMVFEVADQGPGIEAEEQDRVFDEFYRCPARVQETGESGSGLGLSIVRRLAELLGAQVTLRSAPGQGSTFGFVVPLSPSPSEARTSQAI